MAAIAKLTKLSTILAALLATLISVGIPVGYFYLGYQDQQAVTATEAKMNSILISQAIGASPDYWRYEEHRLAEILDRHSVRGIAEVRRILAADGSVIAQSEEEIAPPFVTVTHDLFDSGKVVGQITITTSLRPLVMQTIGIGIISTLLGLAIFAILKFFPLRALAIALRSVYEERERALALLNNIPDLAWLKDRDDRFVAVNGPYGRLCGVHPRDLPGMTDLDIWPKELAEKYQADDREVMASGKRKATEEEVVDSEGRSTWISTIKCPVFDAQGEVIGTSGIGRDISERKQMEEELKRKNISLTTQQETSLDGILVVDEKGSIISLNRRFAEMWGIPPEIIEARNGEPAFQFIATQTDDTEGFLARVRYLDKHIEEKSQEEILLKDGRVFDRYSAPMNGPDWQGYGRVWYFRDITERKLAQESLKKEKEYTQALIECLPGIFFLIDDKGKIQKWNKNIEDLLGYSSEEISSRPPLNFFSTQDQEMITSKIQEVFTLGSAKTEASLASKNGRKIPYLLTGVRIEIDGAPYLVGIGMDIREQKKAENEIRKLNENLEVVVSERTRQLLDAQDELIRNEKLAILGQLSGSVGHELRNPLGVMSNAVYFLKMVNADADETTKEYLEIIKHEIDNSLQIISDLLDFARTKKPQTKLVQARQLLNESLEKCVIPEIVDLQIDLSEHLPPLKVDPLQMEQVFTNLVTNAVQAMAAGGALRITARKIMNDEFRMMSSDQKFIIHDSKLDGDFVAISVTDSGEGITPDNMKKLYQPLFTTKARGIGLGLVVCKNLVEANDGHITVESELGKGTIFTVYLPAGE